VRAATSAARGWIPAPRAIAALVVLVTVTSWIIARTPHAKLVDFFEHLPETLVTGITQGAMIALVALGYTMVYGVLKLINFAHSEVFMMSAYVGLFLIMAFGGNANPMVAGIAGTLISMMAAALMGITVERVAYRPLRVRGKGGDPILTALIFFVGLPIRLVRLVRPETKMPEGSPAKGALVRITPLVTALGMSVLLQNLAQLLFTARFRPYPQLMSGTVHVPGVGQLSTSRVLILVAAVVVMAGLELIVKKTWFGKAMRALSANEEAARLMGVNTSRVISMTFALGSSLAALGAVLYCLDQSQAYPTMGVVIGTRAFVAAVLGGIGSIPGAMLGGLLIGIIGELVKLTDYSGGVDVLVFLVLILVLLVRPAGLLGSTRAEKV
jgi:branched-chain amino acid transport system permease protein